MRTNALMLACATGFLLPLQPSAWAEGPTVDPRFIYAGEKGETRRALKWGEPKRGTGAVIYYALVNEPTKFSGLPRGRCINLEPLEKTLTASGVGLERFKEEVEKAARGWSAIADVSFRYADGAQEADVLIGVQPMAEGMGAYSNLQPDLDAKGEFYAVRKGAVCLNAQDLWRVAPAGSARGIRRVLEHEFGHILGLAHAPQKSRAVMAYDAWDNVEFSKWDIEGAQYLYGTRVK